MLVYGWVLLRASAALRQIERQVEREGVATEGVVTARRVSPRRRGATIYYLTYQYTPHKPDGTSQNLTNETAVAYADYDRYFVGDKIPLRYLPDVPGVVRLGDGIRETFTGTKMCLNAFIMLVGALLPFALFATLIHDQVRYNALPGAAPQGRLLVPILVDAGNGKSINQIFRFDLDGSSRSNLTRTRSDEFDPAWSPDGQQIAFVSSRDNREQIYLMNADGSNPRNISPNPRASDRLPLWSPDGRYILFEEYYSAGSKWDIWVMDADGKNPKNLSSDHTRDNARMSWSPDSKQFAFSGWTEGGSGIWIMDLDGAHAVSLTPPDSQDFDPVWSPDGKQIAFVRGLRTNEDVWLINVNRSDVRQLTSDRKSISQLAWSPDGKNLAFISSASGYNELYIMQPDGNSLQKAAPTNAADLNFVWSPDNSQILVESNLTGGKMGVLMLIDLVTKKRTTIVDDVYCGRMPAWMPIINVPA